MSVHKVTSQKTGGIIIHCAAAGICERTNCNISTAWNLEHWCCCVFFFPFCCWKCCFSVGSHVFSWARPRQAVPALSFVRVVLYLMPFSIVRQTAILCRFTARDHIAFFFLRFPLCLNECSLSDVIWFSFIYLKVLLRLWCQKHWREEHSYGAADFCVRAIFACIQSFYTFADCI